MIKDDTWYRCTICGREGRVGRCCGDETRIPLNRLAKIEQGMSPNPPKIAQNTLCEIAK